MNIKEEFKLEYPADYLAHLQSKIQVSSAQFDIGEYLFAAFQHGVKLAERYDSIDSECADDGHD